MTPTSGETDKQSSDIAPSMAGHAENASNSEKSKRVLISSVTDLGLSLVKVQMTSLLCLVEQTEQTCLPLGGDLRQEGRLMPGSLSPSGFRSEISWTLEWPGMEKKPLSLAGKHVLIFSTSRPATENDAKFYSQVNSVILIHPYLRQLIEDVSYRCLGQSIMVRTLDVPGFVRRETERFYAQQGSQASEE